MVSPAIPSLAILKVNWDTFGKDYIENFVPFIAQCIVSLKSTVISVGEVQDRMLQDFGIRIPQNSLKVILNRAIKKGYITKNHGVYVPNINTLVKLDFETTRQRVLREHNATVEKLIDFCDKKYKVTLQKDNAEAALLSYIADHQIEILSSSVDGMPILQAIGSDKRTEFLINAFIIHLNESDPEGFKYLDTVVKGNMLANALLYPDINRVQSRFEGTEVYFDTAFLIRAIGLEGPRRQAPCRELIDLLYEKGAELRCFQHTLDEIRNIFYVYMNMFHSGYLASGHGTTFRYLVDVGYKASDLMLELNRLEKKLEQLRVKVSEKPEYVERLQINEKALEQSLQETIGYAHDKARIHDVDCLSAIYRLRKGRDCYNIERCLAIFLTTNGDLAKVSRRFFNQESRSSNQTVPLAMTDHSLTTILWLKKPLAAPDLPRKHIIADCYAAMEPGDKLWKKYLTEISRLQSAGDISSDDYYLLRASVQARTELMELTMGEEDAFARGTVQEILQRIKQNIKAEETAKVVAERILREQTEQELQSMKVKQEKVVAERILREQTEQELQSMKVKQEASEQAKQKQLDIITSKIESFARKLARPLSWIPFGVSVFILIIGAYATFPNGLLKFTSDWWNYLGPVALFIFLTMSILNVVFGTTVKWYSRRIELFIAKYIECRLKKWFIT